MEYVPFGYMLNGNNEITQNVLTLDHTPQIGNCLGQLQIAGCCIKGYFHLAFRWIDFSLKQRSMAPNTKLQFWLSWYINEFRMKGGIIGE